MFNSKWLFYDLIILLIWFQMLQVEQLVGSFVLANSYHGFIFEKNENGAFSVP